MLEILRLLTGPFAFLWNDPEARVTDSFASTSFGNATLTVETPGLRLRFTRDRGQVFLDLQGPGDDAKWCSADLVQRMLDPSLRPKAEASVATAEFVERRAEELAEAFGPANRAATHKEIQRLRKVRGKEMFG